MCAEWAGMSRRAGGNVVPSGRECRVERAGMSSGRRGVVDQAPDSRVFPDVGGRHPVGHLCPLELASPAGHLCPLGRAFAPARPSICARSATPDQYGALRRALQPQGAASYRGQHLLLVVQPAPVVVTYLGAGVRGGGQQVHPASGHLHREDVAQEEVGSGVHPRLERAAEERREHRRLLVQRCARHPA
ncbi:MAG: hypothetical protein QOD35_3026 [Nocardioidaceae bacterium]|nr:hypothetical protein [Nocardioidaceae bacterium]